MKMFIPFLTVHFLILKVNTQCWKQSYIRGLGVPMSKCSEGKEKNGALCYNKCENGLFLSLSSWQRDGYSQYITLCHGM